MIAQDSGYQGSEYIQRLGNPEMGQSRMPSHEERDAGEDDDTLLCGGGVGGVGEETVALGRTPISHPAIFHVSTSSTLLPTQVNPLNLSTSVSGEFPLGTYFLTGKVPLGENYHIVDLFLKTEK